jgi:zinc protease
MCKFVLALLVALAIVAPTPAATKLPSPRDFDVRKGKLGNGLSYYIGRSSDPGEKTSFKLIVRVGTLRARPEPQSAHVLEHIIIEKLRDVKSAGSIWDRASRLNGTANASTGAFNTSYYIELPAEDPSAAAAGLDILTDWASAGSISDEEIDRERKAVIEEIRQSGREGVDPWQLRQAVWFSGHPFLDLTPRRSGVIDASAAKIRMLHQQYYVPANMAVVITGHIDPDTVLREISTRLGTRPGGRAATPIQVPAPVSAGGHYLPLAGEETVVEVTYKMRPARARSQRIVDNAVRQIVEKLAPQGFANLTERQGAPITNGFLAVSSRYTNVFGTDLLMGRVIVRRGSISAALSETLGLLEGLRRRGFSVAEIEGAKADMLQMSLPASNIRAQAERWTEMFTGETPSPSAAQIRSKLANLTAAEVNLTLRNWLNPVNRDIFVSYAAKDKANVPSEADVTALLGRLGTETAISFSPTVVREPVLASVKAEPRPVPSPTLEADDVLRWKLPRSGATLLFRHANGNLVRLDMRRPGGEARFVGSLAASARAASDIVGQSGLGRLNRFEFERYLADHRFAVATSVQANSEQVSASGPADSWPQIVNLARARMTDAQCSEAAFREYLEGQRDVLGLEGAAGDDEAFSDLIESAFGYKRRPNLDDLATFTLDKLCRQYESIFGDTAGMTIFVEGDIPAEEAFIAVSSALDIPAKAPPPAIYLKPVVESSAGRTVLRRGTRPLAKVALVIAVKGYAPEAQFTPAALSLRIFDRLRSVEKGTYSPLVSIGSDVGRRGTTLIITFSCAPENVERLIIAAKAEVDRFGRDGLTEVELEDARAKLQSGEQTLTTESAIETWVAMGVLRIDSPTPTDQQVTTWSREFFRSSRMHEFILLPTDVRSHSSLSMEGIE